MDAKMVFYIKIDGGIDIQLPIEYTLDERISFCDNIINEHPQYFDMALNSTSHRLDIMANYILDAANKDGEYPLLTAYKERRNKIKEITFSEIEQKYNNNEKNY